MAGLFKFDFYVKDWFADTRDLTQAAKGCYVDLLAAMYARGGGLPIDENELCPLSGCKTVRSLRPLLGELLSKGKLHFVDGQLVNHRALEEIAKVDALRSAGSKGGKVRSAAIRREYDRNTSGTPLETPGNIWEKQGVNHKLSPSPSPSIKEEKKYTFVGQVIRLTEKDFNNWREVYHAIPDLRAELAGLDDWWSRVNPEGSPKRNDWWHPIRGMLNKKHQRLVAERNAAADSAKGGELDDLGLPRAPSTDWDAEYRKMGVLL